MKPSEDGDPVVSDAGTGAILAPVLAVMAVVVSLALLGVARVFSPRRKSPGAGGEKARPEPASTLRPGPVQCATALTAVASVAAAVLLYPWAAVVGAAPLLVLAAAALFVVVIVAGLLCARGRASR